MSIMTGIKNHSISSPRDSFGPQKQTQTNRVHNPSGIIEIDSGIKTWKISNLIQLMKDQRWKFSQNIDEEDFNYSFCHGNGIRTSSSWNWWQLRCSIDDRRFIRFWWVSSEAFILPSIKLKLKMIIVWKKFAIIV